MNSLELKNKIIERIIEIDDVNILQSIYILFNTSDKNIDKFLKFVFEKTQDDQLKETEDFTAYIKEWVKNM
ncbi:hypothetical protein [Lutibacter sp.]|uniref:hypothetical protein n=1 Tax=Lutibacter sp. TaxID=1925666 RepID=UPI003568C7C7